jgi:ABC-type thiamin/hydroxymethylpyrimidine transport system permease subunit
VSAYGVIYERKLLKEGYMFFNGKWSLITIMNRLLRGIHLTGVLHANFVPVIFSLGGYD